MGDSRSTSFTHGHSIHSTSTTFSPNCLTTQTMLDDMPGMDFTTLVILDFHITIWLVIIGFIYVVIHSIFTQGIVLWNHFPKINLSLLLTKSHFLSNFFSFFCFSFQVFGDEILFIYWLAQSNSSIHSSLKPHLSSMHCNASTWRCSDEFLYAIIACMFTASHWMSWI